MFRTGMTKGIYRQFVRSLLLNKSESETSPFIFVDPTNGQMKFLTKLMRAKEGSAEIFAVSIGTGGDVEILSTEGH